MKTVILVLLFTMVTLAGCTTPPVRPELSGSMATEFSQRKAPDSGGRIYVAMGVYKLPFSTVSRGWDSGELLINGTRVETVHNNPEFIVIDLQPGQYIVTWLLLSGSERLKASANSTVVTVQDGEAQFLALDVTEGMNWGAAFGAIGALVGATQVTRVTDVRKEITVNMLDGKRPVSYIDLRKQKL